jgi:hypothetical protein
MHEDVEYPCLHLRIERFNPLAMRIANIYEESANAAERQQLRRLRHLHRYQSAPGR